MPAPSAWWQAAQCCANNAGPSSAARHGREQRRERGEGDRASRHRCALALRTAPSRRDVAFLGTARRKAHATPTMIDAVQWNIELVLAMHQLMSLCTPSR